MVQAAVYKRKSRWQRFVADKTGHWDRFFEDPTEFWDQRKTKLKENYADFEHKTNSQFALWIDRHDQDLRQRLALLDSASDGSSRVLTQALSTIT